MSLDHERAENSGQHGELLAGGGKYQMKAADPNAFSGQKRAISDHSVGEDQAALREQGDWLLGSTWKRKWTCNFERAERWLTFVPLLFKA